MDTNLWKIESLRLTNFVGSDFDSKNLEKWLYDICGVPPIQINKNMSSFLGLSKLETSMLKLEWQQNRLNIFESTDAPNIENNIGNFSKYNEYYENHILKYFELEGCPVLDRLALGIILYIPLLNNETGIQTMEPLLKTVKGIENAEDFQFRINWPTKTEIAGGIKVNRLLTWTIGTVQLFQINIQNGIAQNLPIATPPELQLRLEIDLSTDQNVGNKISLEQQKEIIHYFSDIVKKVAQYGEYGLFN